MYFSLFVVIASWFRALYRLWPYACVSFSSGFPSWHDHSMSNLEPMKFNIRDDFTLILDKTWVSEEFITLTFGPR